MTRWIAPVVLALVFAFAGGTKFADQRTTAAGFSALGLRHPERLAVQVPTVEVSTAILLLVAPVGGAVVALLLLVGFTWFLTTKLRERIEVPCRCFGGTRPHALSWRDVLRNLALAAVAGVALVVPPT